MVLPPPSRDNNVTHLHNVEREAMCPCIVSQGLILGTLSKKKEHKTILNTKFWCSHIRHSVSCLFMQSSMVVLQSKVCAFKHCATQCMCAREVCCKAADPVICPMSRTITFSDRLLILCIGTWEPTFSVPASQWSPINSSMLWGPGENYASWVDPISLRDQSGSKCLQSLESTTAPRA